MQNTIRKNIENAVEKLDMCDRFYAIYKWSGDIVLVFSSESERDEYIWYESMVHPDISAITYEEIYKLINGKYVKYDDGFGCMVITL